MFWRITYTVTPANGRPPFKVPLRRLPGSLAAANRKGHKLLASIYPSASFRKGRAQRDRKAEEETTG
jgi:hypothetical protein